MNYDSVWQNVRYLMISGMTVLVTIGIMKAPQQATWLTLITHFDALIPALVGIGAWAWGIYVKWNTTPVADTVIDKAVFKSNQKRRIPVVSSATGMEAVPVALDSDGDGGGD